ncbi:MAG: hypothetical protein ACTSW1_07680 [Candidatus Hodarchaeales archaeon]
MKKSPCKECICVPVCKNKIFDRIIEDCLLVRVYLFHESSGVYVISQKFIKGLGWHKKRDGYGKKIDTIMNDLKPFWFYDKLADERRNLINE